MDENKTKKTLIYQEKYLKEWLEDAKNINKAIPTVENILAITEWQLQAIDSQPNIAKEKVSMEIPDVENKYAYLKNQFPSMHDYSSIDYGKLSAVTISGSSSLYGQVVKTGHLNDPEAIKYSEKQTASYLKLQKSQERPLKDRELLVKLNNPQTLGRFDDAFEAYNRTKSQISKRTEAANAMRNLLYGLNGDLFEKARKPKEQKLRFVEAVKRLFQGDTASSEYQELINQAEKYSELTRELSKISKDRGCSQLDLDNIWISIIDLIYIVLGLIDF